MSLSDYFRSQADWRRQRAEAYPEDERNAQSAEALESLASYVEPDDGGWHEASQVLAGLDEHLFEGVTLGGEETQREVSRYGFGYRVTEGHHAEFLEELGVLCLVDAYEFAREHRNDPTGTLFDFEIAAAGDEVMLPRHYFEMRHRSAVNELQSAVFSYRGETAVVKSVWERAAEIWAQEGPIEAPQGRAISDDARRVFEKALEIWEKETETAEPQRRSGTTDAPEEA